MIVYAVKIQQSKKLLHRFHPTERITKSSFILYNDFGCIDV